MLSSDLLRQLGRRNTTFESYLLVDLAQPSNTVVERHHLVDYLLYLLADLYREQ